ILPRSCLRVADSKSNSSTRWPRRTTTRVSSGCAASTSILLGIDRSLDGRLAGARRNKAARAEPGLIVVERVSRDRAGELCSPWSAAGVDCRSGVEVRHGLAVAAREFCCDARFDHDLPILDGAARLLSAAALC